MATIGEQPDQAQPPAPQGEVQSAIEQLKAQVKAWLPSVIIAVIVVLAFTAYRVHKKNAIERASQMLGGARTTEHLQEILTRYPSAPAAALARLELAKKRYDAGDYVAANSTYTDFDNKYPKHPLLAIAKMGRIECLEAMGQTAEALAGFAAFASNHVDHFLTPLALFGQARCLERLRRYDEAKAIYEDFLVAHTNSPWRADAEEALMFLKREMRKPSVKL